MKYCKQIEKVPSEIIKTNGKKYIVIKHDTIIRYKIDTTTITKRGKDIYHESMVYVYVPTDKPIDTIEILKDYFTKNVYKDTLKLNDSLGFVYIIDTISENKILFRNFNAKINEKHIKETIIVVEPPKVQVYFGVNANFNKKDLINSIGISGLYKTKTDKIYQLGVGVMNQGVALSPFVYGGIFWKIK